MTLKKQKQKHSIEATLALKMRLQHRARGVDLSVQQPWECQSPLSSMRKQIGPPRNNQRAHRFQSMGNGEARMPKLNRT